MKKQKSGIFLLIVIIIIGFSNCGGEQTGETGDTPVNDVTKEAALYPEGTLDPSLVTAIFSEPPGVTVLSGEAYGMVRLEDCTLINR